MSLGDALKLKSCVARRACGEGAFRKRARCGAAATRPPLRPSPRPRALPRPASPLRRRRISSFEEAAPAAGEAGAVKPSTPPLIKDA